jgi:hypothetical protein
VSSLRAVARAAGRYRSAVSIAALRPGMDVRGFASSRNARGSGSLRCDCGCSAGSSRRW